MRRRRRCLFSGRVQGVGFRYTAQSIAAQYDIRGYVKNLADGRVELVMEGDEAEMERVAKEIGEKLDGFIRERTDEVSEASGEFKDFSIRH
jgi:acylphosphatase